MLAVLNWREDKKDLPVESQLMQRREQRAPDFVLHHICLECVTHGRVLEHFEHYHLNTLPIQRRVFSDICVLISAGIELIFFPGAVFWI